MMGRKFLVIFMALVFGSFMASCNGDNGEDEDGDADVQQEDIPSEADAEVPPDIPVEDVPVEDIPAEDIPAEDIPSEDIPVTAEVSGRVWIYSPMVDSYSADPAGSIEVTAVAAGLVPADYTIETADENCDDWWSLEATFNCGRFAIDNIPTGTEMMLRAKPNVGTDPETISRIFNVDDAGHEVMVLTTQSLIDALMTAWSFTPNADYGMVVGILVENVNPDPAYGGADYCPTDPSDCELSGFIGEATVEVNPMPTCTDCMQLVYFDSVDYTVTTRESTDPAQSLFFIANVPPQGTDSPYTLTVTHATRTFENVDFAVEIGNVTYLLLVPAS